MTSRRTPRRVASLVALLGVTLGVIAAAFAISASTGPGPDAVELKKRVVAPGTFASLTRPQTAADRAAIAELRQGGASVKLERVRARLAEARIASRGAWGRVVLMPVDGVESPGLCISVTNPAGQGLLNCPAIDAIAAGEVILPLWDEAGATVGMVGVLPDGIVEVRDSSDSTAPVTSNIFVMLGRSKAPDVITLRLSDGTEVERRRLAAAPNTP